MDTQAKILIVEDDELLLSSLVDRFQSEGYAVISAVNGEEGLRAFLDKEPDLVISDVVMPKMDGIQMLKEMKRQKPKDQTPIVMLTNSGDMNNLAEALATHAVLYLLKSDLKLDDLVRTVQEKLKA